MRMGRPPMFQIEEYPMQRGRAGARIGVWFLAGVPLRTAG